MKPLVQTNIAAAALVVGAFVATSLLEWWVTYRTRLAEDRTDRVGAARRMRAVLVSLGEMSLLATRQRGERDRNTKQILILLAGVGLFVGWLAAMRVPRLRMPGNPWAPLVIGLALMWAGIALRVWAVAVLGRFFRRVVVVQEGHRVVTDGPYRFIRHPAYAGTLLTYLGVGVALGNWLSVAACFVIPLLGHLPRIAAEESALTASLSAEYGSYARRTARILPGVW
jgi:protein-S-isoprenylcysteine O-methyltransferase Ste14